jgi:hypothetical protein
MANPRYDRLSFYLLVGVTGHVPRQLCPRHVDVHPVAPKYEATMHEGISPALH